MSSEKKVRRVWSREETILALGLYVQLPFGRIHGKTPEIIALAEKLGRTSNAVAMKMCNIAHYDPVLVERGISGLTNGGHMDEDIWKEFAGKSDLLSSEYVRLLSELAKGNRSKAVTATTSSALANHEFFKTSVLSAYNNSCCITGISDPRLLVADHIKPLDKCMTDDERMDVQNGICLSSLYDSAFTQGLITIDTKYRVVLSHSLKEHMTKSTYSDFFLRYDNKKIILPHRGLPREDFLKYHNEYVFVA